MESITKQIKVIRKNKGLSLSQVARRAGTSVATLSRYENGWDRFEVQTLNKLASALGCRCEVRFVPDGECGDDVSERAVVRRLGRLFWDKPLTSDLLHEYPRWVLERVLDYGSLDDVHTLRDYWGVDAFLKRVSECRFQSEKTKHFWEALLLMEGMSCAKKFSRPTVLNY